MNDVNLGLWGKLTKVVVGLLLLAGFLFVGAWYLPLINENTRMRSQILKLGQQLEAEQEKSKQLQAQIEALRNDPKTVERLAREKLDYAKPDETVVLFTNNLPR